MDILLLLVPLSIVLVAAIGVALFWAVNTGQFELDDCAARHVVEDQDRPNPS